MGSETMEHYNQKILVGFEESRGKAWHYKEDLQGDEPNHYTGPIPVADIRRRLFSWEAISSPVYFSVPSSIDEATGMDSDGNPFKMVQASDRKAIVHGRDGNLFGIFKSGYEIHQFDEWLVNGLMNLVDDSEVGFGSAGLLKQDSIAFVTIETPDNITVVDGFEVRPHILATTSHNGTLATTYKMVNTFVVCDNTHYAALGERGQEYKTRHSKYSGHKLQSARDALGLIHQATDDIVAEVTRLADWDVSDEQWKKIIDTLVPVPKLDESTQTAVTRAENKRASIDGLYKHDERVAPFAGTALGVLQAFNTWNHHLNGDSKKRAERNMLNALNGTTQKQDAQVMRVLEAVAV